MMSRLHRILKTLPLVIKRFVNFFDKPYLSILLRGKYFFDILTSLISHYLHRKCISTRCKLKDYRLISILERNLINQSDESISEEISNTY